jgi:sugar phosphate isomerase/epimerase
VTLFPLLTNRPDSGIRNGCLLDGKDSDKPIALRVNRPLFATHEKQILRHSRQPWQSCDRFLSSGYKDVLPKKEMVRQAAAISGIEGLELVGTWDITEKNVAEVKGWLTDSKLTCVSIIPDLFAQKRWGNGALSARDAGIRQQALEETRMVSRIAREIGCPLINLWLGQDGYDYPLTADYRARRGYLTENIVQVASEFPDLKYALEHKPKEPR